MNAEFQTPKIVGSEPAQEAAAQALSESDDGRSPLALLAMSDEELVAYVGDPKAVRPLSPWYTGLSGREAQLVQAAALRALASRDQFAVVTDLEGNEGYHLTEAALAALELRTALATMTVKISHAGGDSWYILRPAGSGWLREVVSPQGYHAFSLGPGDTEQRDLLLSMLGVTAETPSADDVSEVLSRPQVEGAEGERLLGGLSHSASLALDLGPGAVDESSVFTTHVRTDDGSLFIGVPQGEQIRYSGATGGDILGMWDTFVGSWHVEG